MDELTQGRGGPVTSVAVLGHVNENYGGVQALLEFLPPRVNRVAAILHPLRPTTGEPASRLLAWQAGQKREDIVVPRGSGSDPLEAFVDLLLVARWARRLGPRSDLLIGVNPLNALVGIALRALGRADRVVFYAIDYTPRRYASRLVNGIYQRLVRFVASRADFVWSVSNRIRAVWRDIARAPEGRNLLVPIGIPGSEAWTKRERPTEARSHLVFVGNLTREKGLQLALEALPEVVAAHPDVCLTVVGSGPYEADLRQLAEALGLGPDRVTWLGHVDHDRLPEILASCGIALAPYTEDDGNIARFADVTKPKEYLACGLPVVVTKIPEVAETIERLALGIVVGYSKEELVRALGRLLSDEALYARLVRNVLHYSQDLGWGAVFERAFRGMGCADEVPGGGGAWSNIPDQGLT